MEFVPNPTCNRWSTFPVFVPRAPESLSCFASWSTFMSRPLGHGSFSASQTFKRTLLELRSAYNLLPRLVAVNMEHHISQRRINGKEPWPNPGGTSPYDTSIAGPMANPIFETYFSRPDIDALPSRQCIILKKPFSASQTRSLSDLTSRLGPATQGPVTGTLYP